MALVATLAALYSGPALHFGFERIPTGGHCTFPLYATEVTDDELIRREMNTRVDDERESKSKLEAGIRHVSIAVDRIADCYSLSYSSQLLSTLWRRICICILGICLSR